MNRIFFVTLLYIVLAMASPVGAEGNLPGSRITDASLDLNRKALLSGEVICFEHTVEVQHLILHTVEGATFEVELGDYTKRDGTQGPTGHWDFGGYNLTNLGTLSAINVNATNLSGDGSLVTNVDAITLNSYDENDFVTTTEILNYYTIMEADTRFVDTSEMATALSNYYTKSETDATIEAYINPDDYLELDGSDAMAGDLDLGNNDLVDGKDATFTGTIEAAVGHFTNTVEVGTSSSFVWDHDGKLWFKDENITTNVTEIAEEFANRYTKAEADATIETYAYSKAEVDSILDAAKEAHRVLYVRTDGNDSGSGSELDPFLTIGHAYDTAITMTPTAIDPVVIDILGKFTEQVTVEVAGIHLYGYGQGVTQWHYAGNALIIADNGVDPEPWDMKIKGISFHSTDSGEYAVKVQGIAGTSLAGDELQFMDCRFDSPKGIHINLANYIDFQNTYGQGSALYEQVCGIWYEGSESAGNITVDWDDSGDKPSGGSHYGVNFVQHLPRGSITLLHSGEVGENYRPRELDDTTISAAKVWSSDKINTELSGKMSATAVLDDLSDVNASAPNDGESLVWKDVPGEWTSEAVSMDTSFYRTYYVAPNGNDTTGDGSFSNPWATPGKLWTEIGQPTSAAEYQYRFRAYFAPGEYTLTGTEIVPYRSIQHYVAGCTFTGNITQEIAAEYEYGVSSSVFRAVPSFHGQAFSNNNHPAKQAGFIVDGNLHLQVESGKTGSTTHDRIITNTYITGDFSEGPSTGTSVAYMKNCRIGGSVSGTSFYFQELDNCRFMGTDFDANYIVNIKDCQFSSDEWGANNTVEISCNNFDSGSVANFVDCYFRKTEFNLVAPKTAYFDAASYASYLDGAVVTGSALSTVQRLSVDMEEISDVTISSIQDQQVLFWDNATSEWKNTDISNLITDTYEVTRVHWVDGNRTDSYIEDGSERFPWKTIQAALDDIAQPTDGATELAQRDILLIYTGRYDEDLTVEINLSVSLIGIGPVVLGDGVGTYYASTTPRNITINFDDTQDFGKRRQTFYIGTLTSSTTSTTHPSYGCGFIVSGDINWSGGVDSSKEFHLNSVKVVGDVDGSGNAGNLNMFVRDCMFDSAFDMDGTAGNLIEAFNCEFDETVSVNTYGRLVQCEISDGIDGTFTDYIPPGGLIDCKWKGGDISGSGGHPMDSESYSSFLDNGGTFTGGGSVTLLSKTAIESVISDASIDDLDDVNVSSPNDNDVLTYDSGTGEWTSETASGGDFSDGGDSTGAARSLGNNDAYDMSLRADNQNLITLRGDGNNTVEVSSSLDMKGNDIVGVGNSTIEYQNGNKIVANNFTASGDMVLEDEVDNDSVSWGWDYPIDWGTFNTGSGDIAIIEANASMPFDGEFFEWRKMPGLPSLIYKSGTAGLAFGDIPSNMGFMSSAVPFTLDDNGRYTFEVDCASTFGSMTTYQVSLSYGLLPGLGLVDVLLSETSANNITFNISIIGGGSDGGSFTGSSFTLRIVTDYYNDLIYVYHDSTQFPLSPYSFTSPQSIKAVQFYIPTLSGSGDSVTFDNVKVPSYDSTAPAKMICDISTSTQRQIYKPVYGIIDAAAGIPPAPTTPGIPYDRYLCMASGQNWIQGNIYEWSYNTATWEVTTVPEVGASVYNINVFSNMSGNYAKIGMYYYVGSSVWTYEGTLVSLNNLSDVSDTLNPADGQVLAWNDSSSKWTAETVVSGTNTTEVEHIIDDYSYNSTEVYTKAETDSTIETAIGAISLALDDLSDVNVDTPEDGEALVYDSGTGEWTSEVVGGTTYWDADGNDIVNNNIGNVKADSLEITGYVSLPQTSGNYTGTVIQNNERFLHSYPNENSLFLGAQAGNYTLTGTANMGIGSFALQDLTSGYNNTAVGHSVGTEITEGFSNVGVGHSALVTLTTGDENTAIGAGTLYDCNSNKNTAMGYISLSNITSGDTNTAVGYRAGYTNTTGSRNVFLGSDAGYYETGSNKLFIDVFPRDTESNARDTALIYGIFDNSVANQKLYLNAGSVEVKGVMKADTFEVGSTSGFVGFDGTNLTLSDGETGTKTLAELAAGGGSGVFEESGNVVREADTSYDNDFVFGSPGLDYSTQAARFFFNKGSSAFRAGYCANTNWDNENIGTYSMAFGANPKASGNGAIALGSNCESTGTRTFTQGTTSKAGGTNAIAMGYYNEAVSNYSTALGYKMKVGTTSTDAQYSFGISLSSEQHNLSQANSLVIMGGDVGINDTTPSYKLDVNGDINFTGNLREDGDIVSIPIVKSGTVEVTCSSSNDYDTAEVTFSTSFSGTPAITVSPFLSDSNTQMFKTGVNAVSGSAFEVVVYHDMVDDTVIVNWIATEVANP